MPKKKERRYVWCYVCEEFTAPIGHAKTLAQAKTCAEITRPDRYKLFELKPAIIRRRKK